MPPNRDLESANTAIENVKNILDILILGPPLIRRGPRGDITIDIPIMYNGYALDRIHFDPYKEMPSPKGGIVHAFNVEIDREKIMKILSQLRDEFEVVDAVEFREPEDAWAVPLKWRKFIIAHIKVSREHGEIVPDYPLTEEVKRHVL